MAGRKEKFVKVIIPMIILVAVIQVLWPFVYYSPFITNLNPYPTKEYLQILWLLSPNGLTTLTVILGCIALAWVAFTDL